MSEELIQTGTKKSLLDLIPIQSLKTLSMLLQFVQVCSIYTQSQKLPRIHGVKFGSRLFGSSEAISWVTANCKKQLMIAWTLYFRGRVG